MKILVACEIAKAMAQQWAGAGEEEMRERRT